MPGVGFVTSVKVIPIHPVVVASGAGEPTGNAKTCHAVVVATLAQVKLTENAVKLFEFRAVGLKQVGVVVNGLGPAHVLKPFTTPQSVRT